MPTAEKCVPFDRTRVRRARSAASRTRQDRGRHENADPLLSDIFEHLSPAQYAFLNGVLAILADHGEEALTKSCEMVLERFGRTKAG